MIPTQHLHQEIGQSLWLDNITRRMLDEGTFQRYVDALSITGLTSNPSIFDKAIGEGDAYDLGIREKAERGLEPEALFTELALEDLRRAADALQLVFETTGGVDGWVSMEVSPLLANDAQGTVAAAAAIHEQGQRPNLFVKIPGNRAGLVAIEESIHAGVPINVTLLFSADQCIAAAEAWMRGLERRQAERLSLDVPGVASLFVSRWDVAVADKVPAELKNRLGIAMAQRTLKRWRELFASPRWQALETAGAPPMRLLWASTGTKDPEAPETLYVDALAARGTINTLPDKTLLALAEGRPVPGPMPEDGVEGEAMLQRFVEAGVDLDALALRLQEEGAEAFVKSWNQLLQRIRDKVSALGPAGA